MKTCVDKSEGKRLFIILMITKYLILAISFGENFLKFLYNKCVVTLPFLIFVKFCKMYIPKKSKE